MVNFKQISTQAEIESLCALARIIWEEHYSNILSQSQIQYMLEKFQSPPAVQKQIQEGYAYFQVLEDEKLIGYFAFIQKNDIHSSLNSQEIFLSKLYIKQDYRNKGIGKSIIAYLKQIAQNLGANAIWLAVNKQNTNSMQAYKKFGFNAYREDNVLIGNGFSLDDYFMRLEV